MVLTQLSSVRDPSLCSTMKRVNCSPSQYGGNGSCFSTWATSVARLQEPGHGRWTDLEVVASWLESSTPASAVSLGLVQELMTYSDSMS